MPALDHYSVELHLKLTQGWSQFWMQFNTPGVIGF